MRYVDAGYAIGLGALALYGLSLVLRRRRLERAVRQLSGHVPEAGDPSPGGP